MQHPMVTLTSDASGVWGCGAFTDDGLWFQIQWPNEWHSVHITVKGLLPVVVACAVWGYRWRGLTVCCICDNAAVVVILKSGTSRHGLVMHLMRCLFFFIARHQLCLAREYLAGCLNTAADSLSHGNLPLFLQLVTRSSQQPTPLPKELLQALVEQRPAWTAAGWLSTLRSILPRD